jgi:hypothetical protein
MTRRQRIIEELRTNPDRFRNRGWRRTPSKTLLLLRLAELERTIAMTLG